MHSTQLQFPHDFAIGALPVLDDEFDTDRGEDILSVELREVLTREEQ